MAKILIVDDDALIRDSLKIILDLEDDLEVVGLASNGQDAFELCKTLLPDIVLMDIRMPIMDGVLGTKLIKSTFSQIKVIILTTFRDDEYIKEAIKGGAEGYILKNTSTDSIISSIRTVIKGNMVLQKDIMDSLSTMIKTKTDQSSNIKVELTSREMDILRLVGDGSSNKEISEALFLSEGTVRNYITAMLEKLNLRDRTQLAIYYLKNYDK